MNFEENVKYRSLINNHYGVQIIHFPGLCLYSHYAAVRIPPVLLTPGGALAALGCLHALGGALLGAASWVPFKPLALNNEQ